MQENNLIYLNYSATKIKDVHNTKQISLLQRNKSPSAPPASQQDTEQQTDASIDDTSTINESMEKSFTTDNTAIKQGVLNDIRILKGIKFERARKLLKIIEESDSVSLDSSKRLLIKGSNTEVLATTFLYNLQQTTCKLSFEQFNVLALLDIG